MNQRWTERLSVLAIELPPVATPVANYVPAVQVGQLVYTSGQLPFAGGSLPLTGRVGAEVSVEMATASARNCALNALAAIDDLVGVEAIARVVKVTGFIASAPGFHNQAEVLNGASDLIGEIFGDAGKHARSAVGVAELPLNAPVEVEIIIELSEA